MAMFAPPKNLLCTASCVAMSCALIPVTELHSNVRTLRGQRIVLTHFFVGTEGAGRAPRPEINTSFPGMRMAGGALVTAPPHLSCSVRLDEDMPKMTVFGMIPLVLQYWTEQTDVWVLLLACACALI